MANFTSSLISDSASESNQAGWWHPLDSFQGAEYYGICKEYGVAGKHQVELVKRAADGTLTRSLCKNTDGTTAEFDNDIGHNNPSVIVDGDGYIHVFTSMHMNLLRYFKSAAPNDVTNMVDASWNFPDVDWTYTYPTVARGPEGDVYVMMRRSNRTPVNDTKRPGGVYRYRLASKTWERYAPVAEADNRSIYPDDMMAFADGLHLLFQWAHYPSSAVRHVGEYGVIGTDGLMRTINNTPLPMPVTQGQLAYKPLQPGENPAISDGLKMGIQSAKFAFDGEGLSHIVYRFRAVDDPTGTYFSKFGVYVATWNGSAWSEQQIAYVPPERGNTSAALAATVQGGKRRVYFSVEYTSSGNTVAVIVMAENAGSGWVYSVLGNSAPTLLRLGSAPGNGGDVLYVSAPFEAKVYRYFVPEDYSPAQQFTSFDVLLSTLV
ncbi:TPA: BNR-4 repeat-containing protein [Klebsiella pneumoniae]|nr:BNR-4 repeat-containing protein [Klebsiella pneumoniae]